MVTFKRCGHEYIAHCPSVALSDEEDATCSKHAIPGELDALRVRLSAAERERDDLRAALDESAKRAPVFDEMEKAGRELLDITHSIAKGREDAAFARGVEAAAKAARGIAVMASGAKRGDSYKQGFCDGALGVATAIDALSPAPDATKEPTR